jgi:putative membrane protein
VVVTSFALWVAAAVVGGVRLEVGSDPLATIGTVLVVSLLLCLVNTITRGVRRLAAGLAEPLPIGVVVLAVLNACVFWLAGSLAAAMGLGYAVDGFLPALLGSIVVMLVGWAGRLVVSDARS